MGLVPKHSVSSVLGMEPGGRRSGLTKMMESKYGWKTTRVSYDWKARGSGLALQRPRRRSGELGSGRGATTPPPSLFRLREVGRRPGGGPQPCPARLPRPTLSPAPSPPPPRKGTGRARLGWGGGERAGPREQRGTRLPPGAPHLPAGRRLQRGLENLTFPRRPP